MHLLKYEKMKITNLYENHFILMIKHFKQQIFHTETKHMIKQEQSEFLQNVIYFNDIQNFNKT